MSLAQFINQGHICPSRSLETTQIKTFKNLHVYYEKDNLCYLLKLLNNNLDIENSSFFNLSEKIIIR